MKAEKMHVVIDMNDFCAVNGVSKNHLAEAMNKDVSAVKRQLSDRTGNLYLCTAYEYAEHLGGAIVFVTDQQYEDLQQIEILKAKISELDDMCEILRKRVSSFESENRAQEAQISSLIDSTKKLQSIIERKELAIERKDKTLDELLHKYVCIAEG